MANQSVWKIEKKKKKMETLTVDTLAIKAK